MARREAAKGSWEPKQKKAVEEENVPLPSEEPKRSGALFFSRYKLRFSADEDTGETVAIRLKCHLNKHCIRFDNIVKAKARKREAAEARGKRTKLGDETEMTEIVEPVRKQPEAITAEAHVDARWSYILGLVRASVEGLQDKPNAAETDAAPATEESMCACGGPRNPSTCKGLLRLEYGTDKKSSTHSNIRMAFDLPLMQVSKVKPKCHMATRK